MDPKEPLVEMGSTARRVSVTFYVEHASYAEAREAILDFLSSAPPEFARSFGLRAMIIAESEAHDPAAVTFSEN